MIAPLCQHATRDEAVLCPFYRPLKAEQIGQCHGPNAFDRSSITMPKPQHSLLDSSASAMMHPTDSLTDSTASASPERSWPEVTLLPELHPLIFAETVPLTEISITELTAESEPATTDPLQEIRIAEPGPTAYADPKGAHAHGKGGDAASKRTSPLPLVEPTAALATQSAHHDAANQDVADHDVTDHDVTNQASARGTHSVSERTLLHATVCDRNVSLMERYLPELYAPQRDIANTHTIADLRTTVATRGAAEMNVSALKATASHAAQLHDGELNSAVSRTTQPHGRELNTHALHDGGAHGTEIKGHAAEPCESCGEPAQRQCPCGAQICARHFYDAEGAQARGAHGFCAECVDLIREQQHGEERCGVAGDA